jgi:hypothetical protein
MEEEENKKGKTERRNGCQTTVQRPNQTLNLLTGSKRILESSHTHLFTY